MPLFGPNIERLKARGNIESLIKALSQHRDEGVRLAAAQALGEIGAQPEHAAFYGQVIETLGAALKDRHTGVCEEAIKALGQVGAQAKGTTLVRGVLAPLAKGIKSTNDRVRGAAANALGRIGAPAVETLLSVLKEWHKEYAHESVVKALGQIGAPAVGPLTATLAFKRESVRRVAARALDEIGWLPDRSKAGALYWITRTQWERAAEVGAPAVEPLIATLKGEQEGTREGAAKALAQIGSPAVEPLIAVLQEQSKGPRQAAAQALAQLGAPAAPALIPLLSDEQTRQDASGILVQIGEPAWEPILAALQDGHRDVRCAAPSLLAQIALAAQSDELCIDAIEPLANVLGDTSATVRQAAALSLGKIGAPVVAAFRGLRPLGGLVPANLNVLLASKLRLDTVLSGTLCDESADVRRAAVQALDRLGWKPDKSEAGAAYWIVKREWDKCVAIGAPAVGPLSAVLKSEHVAVRQEALSALGRVGGEPAIEVLIASLEDKSPNIRSSAAQALGGAGGARAVTALLAALCDRDKRVQVAAAGALAQIGTPAIVPLDAALHEGPMAMRAQAASVLGRIGQLTRDDRATQALLSSIKDPDALVHRAAIEALDTLGWQPDNGSAGARYWRLKGEWDRCAAVGAPAVEVLLAALQDDQDQVRREAARALGKIGDARALGALVDALSDKDKDTRQAAARALEQTGTPAIAPLSTALQDGPAVVRTQATGALGRIGLSTGDGRAVEPLFSALDDVDVYVRYSAVEALETVLPMVGAGRVVEVLSVALEDREPLLRQAAVELLGKTNRSAVQPLLVALQDRDPDVRHAAIESLDELGWQPDEGADGARYWLFKGKRWQKCVAIGVPAVEPLIAALKDAQDQVRSDAAQALGEIGDARAVQALMGALWDRAESVRHEAACALGEIGDARAVDALLTMLGDRGEGVGMRQTAVEALGQIGDARAVGPLVYTLSDEDHFMRCTVARALVRIYQGGSLDDAQKKQILAQRNWITAEHRDNSTHTDRGHDDKVACSSMHQDTHVDTRRPHIDQTIGVDFPL